MTSICSIKVYAEQTKYLQFRELLGLNIKIVSILFIDQDLHQLLDDDDDDGVWTKESRLCCDDDDGNHFSHLNSKPSLTSSYGRSPHGIIRSPRSEEYLKNIGPPM